MKATKERKERKGKASYKRNFKSKISHFKGVTRRVRNREGQPTSASLFHPLTFGPSRHRGAAGFRAEYSN
jgi:hypothetical protein